MFILRGSACICTDDKYEVEKIDMSRYKKPSVETEG